MRIVVFLLLVVTVPDWVRTSSTSLLVTGVAGIGVVVVFSLWGRRLLTWLERLAGSSCLSSSASPAHTACLYPDWRFLR
jgi:hypothetical protein